MPRVKGLARAILRLYRRLYWTVGQRLRVGHPSILSGKASVKPVAEQHALIPSGRDQTRARLTPDQVEANARDYLKQVSKVIDISRTEVTHNGDWFGKFAFLNVLALTGKITMQRMLERDDFTKRLKAGTPIYLHECLYPLMQG